MDRDIGSATELCLGYPVTHLSLSECVDEIMVWLQEGGAVRTLVCLNPYAAYMADSDCEFASALKAADLLIPDGIGVVLTSRLSAGKISERVTGSDIFESVCASMERSPTNRVFFLGSTTTVLSQLRCRIESVYPGLSVVGTYSPPFRDQFSAQEVAEMARIVNSAEPDALWVGMSAPKQEKWIALATESLNVPFVGAVGAVFDFQAGTVRRPGPLARGLGLEWLGRLVREPRRLWRRSLIAAPWFVRKVLLSHWRIR